MGYSRLGNTKVEILISIPYHNHDVIIMHFDWLNLLT